MKSQPPTVNTATTLDQLVMALNQMRDEWTKAAMELRDIQFDLDSEQCKEAKKRAADLINKVKPR